MSVLGKSGNPVAEPKEESINRDEYGNFKDVNIDELNFDTIEGDSLHSSHVGTVNADMEDAGISGSKVGTLNGDFHLGKYTHTPFNDSEIGEIFGNVVLEGSHEIRGTILRDTTNSDNMNYTSRVGLIVGEKVKGKKISDGSARSVILADEVEVEDYNDEFVLTPKPEDDFPTFEGNFEALKEEAKNEGEGFLQFSGIFGPDFPEVLDSTNDRCFNLQELDQVEGKLEALLEKEIKSPRKKVNSIKESMDIVDPYPINTSYQIQMVDKVINDIPNEDDAKKERVSEFGVVLQDVDEQVFDLLKTEKDLAVVENNGNEFEEDVSYSSGNSKFGKTLFEIATERKYDFFIEEEAEQINNLLELEGDMPELEASFMDSVYSKTFEEDSPYFKMLGEILEEFEDDVRHLRGLAKAAGKDYTPDFGLGSKEGRRKHDPNFDPQEQEDFESLRKHLRTEAEKDIRKKKRHFTKEAIKNLGFREGADKYEEATGKKPNKLTKNIIAALKVRERFDRHDRREMVDKLLTYENDVYKMGKNQEWLEQHSFEADQMIDPDLSDQADGEYRRPEDPIHESELKIEINSEDIEMNTEDEKQQYWGEVTDLLDRVGYDGFVSDIEEAEEAVDDLNRNEDDQDFRELKDAIQNFRSVDERVGGVPDKLNFRVSDPMDTTRMGQGFGSCHDIDGGSYAWASIANAIDANKMIFYAEDEKGRERARVKAFVTEDEELVYHNSSQYKDIEIDTSDYFEGYMRKVSDELGIDLKHSNEVPDWESRMKLLEASEWYSGA